MVQTGLSLEVLALIGLAVAAFYLLLPTPLTPVSWKNPSPLLKFEGPLEANVVLSKAVLVEVRHTSIQAYKHTNIQTYKHTNI
jgi:hypothetical protein